MATAAMESCRAVARFVAKLPEPLVSVLRALQRMGV